CARIPCIGIYCYSDVYFDYW
nr:immunoglobulin heavy chain junction region [Macaca mulatta]